MLILYTILCLSDSSSLLRLLGRRIPRVHKRIQAFASVHSSGYHLESMPYYMYSLSLPTSRFTPVGRGDASLVSNEILTDDPLDIRSSVRPR